MSGASRSSAVRRGLSCARMKPTRSAPASTATSTSSCRVSPQTLTSGREISSASFAPGIGRAHERGADEDRGCPRELGGRPLGAGVDARLGDHDPVAGGAGDELELEAAVDVERREVAGVDSDHGRVERDRAVELLGVVRLDERVEAEGGRLAHQRGTRRVVEVAKEEQHRVGTGEGGGAQVVVGAEEPLGEQRQRRGRAGGAQIAPGAGKALVDEHRHRPRAGLLVGSCDERHVPARTQVACGGRPALELGDRPESGRGQGACEPHLDAPAPCRFCCPFLAGRQRAGLNRTPAPVRTRSGRRAVRPRRRRRSPPARR